MTVASPIVRVARRRLQRIEEAKAIPDNWQQWLMDIVPSYIQAEFSERHIEFWQWVWSIQKGKRPHPFVGIWPRGGAKSTSAELSAIHLGGEKKRLYAWFCCHEEGTTILDSDIGQWINVEQHPTAGKVEKDGLEIKIWGLPFCETVTNDHRYWVRTIHRKDIGHGRPPIHDISDPHWCEAERLDNRTWIGLPIGQTIDDIPSGLHRWLYDPEFWWLIGLWWGDGGRGGGRGKGGLALYIGNKEKDVLNKAISFLDDRDVNWGISQREGCLQLSFYNRELSDWLAEWYIGGNSQKKPPDWVEWLPYEYQINLIKGYVSADGWITKRSVKVASVCLDGLLLLRRILARLNVPATISQVHKQGETIILGRTHIHQDSYALRFQQNASKLGYPIDKQNNWRYQHVMIEDGILWSRIRQIKPAHNRTFIPIQTSTKDYYTHYGRSHNCEVQDQADQHVGTIADILESDIIPQYYPKLAQREVGKYGQSKGWRRERLRCANGFIIDAIGLDTARRGSKAKENRPDLIILDDIDGKHDTPKTTLKKKEIITTSLLPAGSEDVAVLFMQNLIIPDGIASQLAGVSDIEPDFLFDRIVSGPHKAIDNLAYESTDSGYKITAGTPTWEGQGLKECQDAINTWGLSSFLKEAQHEVEHLDGGLFNHLEFRRIDYSELPELIDGAVWCDPAVTSTDQSDSMGICAGGLGVDDKIYIIWAWEQITTPLDCLKKAIVKAVELRFDRVGVETDQGGDLWHDEYYLAVQELAKDDDYPHIVEKEGEVVIATSDGELDNTRFIPDFVADKAGAGYGSKVHRWHLMLNDYEKANIIHVVGTHNTAEKALNRVPKYMPYDYVDAQWWLWNDLKQGYGAVA